MRPRLKGGTDATTLCSLPPCHHFEGWMSLGKMGGVLSGRSTRRSVSSHHPPRFQIVSPWLCWLVDRASRQPTDGIATPRYEVWMMDGAGRMSVNKETTDHRHHRLLATPSTSKSCRTITMFHVSSLRPSKSSALDPNLAPVPIPCTPLPVPQQAPTHLNQGLLPGSLLLSLTCSPLTPLSLSKRAFSQRRDGVFQRATRKELQIRHVGQWNVSWTGMIRRGGVKCEK